MTMKLFRTLSIELCFCSHSAFAPERTTFP